MRIDVTRRGRTAAGRPSAALVRAGLVRLGLARAPEPPRRTPSTGGVATAAAVTAGTVVLGRAIKRAAGRAGGHGDRERWRAVTVAVPTDELRGRPLPGPLADLGDAVEVRLQPAPADKGTELRARLTGRAKQQLKGEDPLQALRSALRQSKQLIEVGEVLQADHPPTTRHTLRGWPLERAVEHAGGEGRL